MRSRDSSLCHRFLHCCTSFDPLIFVVVISWSSGGGRLFVIVSSFERGRPSAALAPPSALLALIGPMFPLVPFVFAVDITVVATAVLVLAFTAAMLAASVVLVAIPVTVLIPVAPFLMSTRVCTGVRGY